MTKGHYIDAPCGGHLAGSGLGGLVARDSRQPTLCAVLVGLCPSQELPTVLVLHLARQLPGHKDMTPPWPCAAGPKPRSTEVVCASVTGDGPGERAVIGHALLCLSEPSFTGHNKAQVAGMLAVLVWRQLGH
jgi:hypothetical protein